MHPAQLFFRTSTSSRSTGRFLSENRILPPLAYSACIHALETLRSRLGGVGPELHFADEEGDPYAVELAGRLGGYVLGNDSDFVILNSDGYRGYIPLDELVWVAAVAEDPTPVDDEDGEFQTVRKPKAKRKVPQNAHDLGGLLPPDDTDGSTLNFVSYSPQALATHLKIPVSLLPLFGALVGNDFSKELESNSRKVQGLFFERSLTLSQRIDKVASTIYFVISNNQRRKLKHPVGSVMDLIDRTVNALLARLASTMGTGEVDIIVEKIVNSTLQYAIPKYGGDVTGREGLWPTSVCALHDPEACSFLPMISANVMRQTEKSDQADPNLLEAREKYLDAYRGGLLSPKMMDTLSTGSSWGRIFLENPDLETVARSIGRPIREWIHTILDDTVGLPVPEIEAPDSTRESIGNEEESDDDELIDVVESDSDDEVTNGRDYLAPLKGELHRLHSDGTSEYEGSQNDTATEPPASIISHRLLPQGPRTVTEYLRRGTRIASDVVIVKPLAELLSSISLSEYADENAPPLVLRSEEERFTIFLLSLKSDLPAVRSLPSKYLLAVLALRWVVETLHTRWQESNSKEREKERWSKNEARCLLSSFAWPSDETSPLKLESPPPIEDRNVQLMAQILMALDTIEQLAQCLLLTDRVPSNAYQLSGQTFHAFLTGKTSSPSSLPSGIWEAVELDLLDSFQEERAKKSKKSRVEKPSIPSPAKIKGNNSQNKGLFAMLGDMEA